MEEEARELQDRITAHHAAIEFDSLHQGKVGKSPISVVQYMHDHQAKMQSTSAKIQATMTVEVVKQEPEMMDFLTKNEEI